jgi:hypothetical protein
MESYLTEEASWASGVAGRLRLIQANFADDEPKVRQGYLAEELERALKTIPSSRREQHLLALSDFFPSWASAAAAPTPDAPSGPARVETPEELLERFIQAAGDLSPEARAKALQRLQEAGLAPKAAGPATADTTLEFWKFFGVTDNTPLNVDRSQKMLVALAGAFLALDQLAWTLWKQLNPKSIYRKEAEFGKMAGPYLASDAEISTEQIRQPLERTRRLVAALLGAWGRGSSNFSRKQSAALSPESVENAARMEKKAWESLESVSWRKYKELFKEYSSEQMLESQIQQEFVRATEELLRGIGR